MRISRILLGAPLLLIACLASSPPTEPYSAHSKHVLFVGNSLTYTNDLPGVFRDLANAGGYDVGVSTLAAANVALIDITKDANAMSVLANGGWNYVVLQQGTTSVPICRDTLVLAARIMDSHIRRGGGVPALMMSWPASNRQHVFPNVHDSYALAAQTVSGIFLPVGDAWLEAWKINPALGLYGSDGYHPSQTATYLAALVIYEKLTGNDARQLPVDLRVGADRIQLPAAVVKQLQEAAHVTNLLPVPPVIVPPTPIGTPISC